MDAGFHDFLSAFICVNQRALKDLAGLRAGERSRAFRRELSSTPPSGVIPWQVYNSLTRANKLGSRDWDCYDNL